MAQLFSFGTPSELATPIGQMVKHATDNLRLVPDWTQNLELCDQVNRKLENIEAVIKAIKRRLHDNNQNTVYLSLILLETCMKNCGPNFHASFDRPLMEEVVKIAKGSKGVKNSEEALRLIQQWGRVFESKRAAYPLFFDTFVGLKSRGISFPKEEDNPVSGYDMDPPKSPSVPKSSSNPPLYPTPAPVPPAPVQNEEDEFFRLQKNLITVMEKVKLCREMLQVSPGIEQDELLADVVGFLEACRDRMVDVIEAGTQGLLGEDLFSECLKVNDAILKTLEAERTGAKIKVEDDETQEGEKKSSGNLLELDSPKPTPTPALAPAFAPASKTATLLEDLSLLDKITPAPASQATVVTNPFDDPFSSSYGKANPGVAVTSAASPAAAPVEDLFANNPFGDASSVPAPPANISNATPLPPKHDDFDIFLSSETPTTVPPASSVPASVPPQPASIDEDFDAFFASLDKK